MRFYDIITTIGPKVKQLKIDSEWLGVTESLVECIITTEPKETLTALLALSEPNQKKLASTINNTLLQLTQHYSIVVKNYQNDFKKYKCELEQHQINPDFIKPIAPKVQIPKLLGLEICLAAHLLVLAMILHVSSKEIKLSLSDSIARAMAHVSNVISLYAISKPETWSPSETEFVLKKTLFKNKDISQGLIEEINKLTDTFSAEYKALSAPIENDDCNHNTPRP